MDRWRAARPLREVRNPFSRPRRTRARHYKEPEFVSPECEIVTVGFEVDDKVVSLIAVDGTRIPLFPSDRIGGLSKACAGNLRSAIVTVMQDLEETHGDD